MVLANIFSPELLIVLVLAVVLLFGANKLPHFARSVGEAGKEFRKAQQESEDEAKAKAAASASIAPPLADDKVTLTKAELDALLAEREAKARREAQTPPTI